jgi:23S rRNA maturation-related 3'-5' exoribonuclease YhaM
MTDQQTKLRENLLRALPEIELIRDEGLREKVIEAWAFSLARNGLEEIDQLPPQAAPEHPPFKPGKGTQSGHFRGVGHIAQGIADGLEKVHPDIKIDRDLLWACALCHDLGKPYEMGAANQQRWKADDITHGDPAIRHPAYGVYVALTVGLPEAVAHAAGYHSGEGELLTRSLIATIVHYADFSYWNCVERAGLLTGTIFGRKK